MKFLQDQIKPWKVEALRVSSGYHFLNKFVSKVLKLTLTHFNNVNNVNNVERRVFFYNFKGKFFYCEENVH